MRAKHHKPRPQPSESQLAGDALTADYVYIPAAPFFHNYQKRPIFSLMQAEAMLYDQQVWYGLCLGNCPLMSAEIKVTGPHEEVNRFVMEQWKRLWATSASQIFRAKYFGYAGYEVLYRECKGRIEFESLLPRHPRDTRPLVSRGQIAGVRVRGTRRSADGQQSNPTDLIGMKGLWLTYNAQYGARYGQPLTETAYPSWWDKAMDGGAYDLRRLRMVKDAWIGDLVRYPTSRKIKLPDGTEISGKDMMREIGELRASGGVIALPSDRDDKGNYLFEYEPPQSVAGETKIAEWVHDLDNDIFDGLLIPREVVEAASTGSGYSGRSIPLMMFLGLRDEEFRDDIRQIKPQIMDPLVCTNFSAAKCDYEIEAVPLMETMGEQVHDRPEGGPLGNSAGGGQLGRQRGGQVDAGYIQFSDDGKVRGGNSENTGQFSEKPGTGASDEKPKKGAGLISPNRRRGMKLAEAVEWMDSQSLDRAQKDVESVAADLGLPCRVSRAAGTWEHGAEPSFVVSFDEVEDFDETKYLMCWQGMLLGQFAVVPFHPDKNGRDVLWTFAVAGDFDIVDKRLQESGVEFRTLQKADDRIVVRVFDKNAELATVLQDASHELGFKLSAQIGTGEIFPDGARNRIEAIEGYRQAISDYESRFPDRNHVRSKRLRDWLRRGGSPYERRRLGDSAQFSTDDAPTSVISDADQITGESIASSNRVHAVIRRRLGALLKKNDRSPN